MGEHNSGEQGPDYSDGCDHEGFPGGCERMGHTVQTCPSRAQTATAVLDEARHTLGTLYAFLVGLKLALPESKRSAVQEQMDAVRALTASIAQITRN